MAALWELESAIFAFSGGLGSTELVTAPSGLYPVDGCGSLLFRERGFVLEGGV